MSNNNRTNTEITDSQSDYDPYEQHWLSHVNNWPHWHGFAPDDERWDQPFHGYEHDFGDGEDIYDHGKLYAEDFGQTDTSGGSHDGSGDGSDRDNDDDNDDDGEDLVGGDDDDSMTGGDGDDTLSGGAGNDVIDGDGGDELDDDELDDDEGDNDALLGNQGDDTVAGGDGNDFVHGGRDNDVLFGNQGSDAMFGGHGNDVMHGGQASDAMFGGDGNDVINGGVGDDMLAGGAGEDVFLFGPNTGNDIVADFEVGADLLAISADAGISSISDLSPTEIANGAGTLLTLSEGNTITLVGIEPSELGAGSVVLF
ncbi:MAG: calcium-binding protein [Rhodospirillaceae bacterium]|nr:calcium-binding protein [Rhodospirillaceae bacterium]